MIKKMKALLVSKDDKIIKGMVSLNGSKSESNRLLIIQALCKDSFKIYNLSKAEDTIILSNLLDKVSVSSHTEINTVSGNCLTAQILDVKDSGTAMRFLTGFLSIKQGKWLYENKWKGNIEGFVGEENIYFNGKKVCFRSYLGGLVKNKR